MSNLGEALYEHFFLTCKYLEINIELMAVLKAEMKLANTIMFSKTIGKKRANLLDLLLQAIKL